MWTTEADARQLAEDCVHNWVQTALGPAEVDEGALHRGIGDLYAALGLPPPASVLILASPLQCAAFEEAISPYIREPRLTVPHKSWTRQRERRERGSLNPREGRPLKTDWHSHVAPELENCIVEMEAIEQRSPHRHIAPLLVSHVRWADALAQIEQRVSRPGARAPERWQLTHARAAIARARRKAERAVPSVLPRMPDHSQVRSQVWRERTRDQEEARRHARRVPGRFRIRHLPWNWDPPEWGVLERTVQCRMEGPGILSSLDRLARNDLLLRLGGSPERFAPVLASLSRAGLWTSRLRRSLAVLCTRPHRIHLDGNLRVHNEHGPAIEWRDGFPDHRLHGVTLSEELFRGLDHLDARTILQIDNVERRRVLFDHIGRERLIAAAAPEVLDEDIDGAHQPRRLLRLATDSEPTVLVEVRCPSTGHLHYLRVPPDMVRCNVAVAWTFGLAAEAYAPLVEA